MANVTRSSAPVKTILVAEDTADILSMLREFLEGKGYRVVEAADGAQAVEVAAREQPDLILLDLNMPVLDGVEAARRIRRHPQLAGVPIVAHSAYGSYGMQFTMHDNDMGQGFNFYLTKPIQWDELTDLLRRLLPSE